MADKAISELVIAREITSSDLFVLEQAGVAKQLSGQTLTTFLLNIVKAHGGIVSIEKTGTNALVDTYTITFADLSTTTFNVTNGAKGDKGDNAYIWIKYANALPTKDTDIYDTPDNYLGVYTGPASTAPTSYSAYRWFQIKGAKGDTGTAARLQSQSVQYQASASGTIIPDGAWLSTVPTVPPGQYLWTKSTLQFNTGAAQTSYSVARFGLDGTGSVSTVAGKSPDSEGNIVLSASDVGARPDDWMPSASDVGARPDDWMPSAADVGAIPASSGSVGTTYLANSSVTRAKLAQDALYSPVNATGSAAAYTIQASDLGKTVGPSSTAASVDVVYTIPYDVSASLPFGAEIAIAYRYGKSLKIVFENGAYSAIPGDSEFVNKRTYLLPERFGMIALKLIDYSSDRSKNYWLVTGNVEVVE